MEMEQVGTRERRQENKKSLWPVCSGCLSAQWSEAPGLSKQMLPKSLLYSQRHLLVKKKVPVAGGGRRQRAGYWDFGILSKTLILFLDNYGKTGTVPSH